MDNVIIQNKFKFENIDFVDKINVSLDSKDNIEIYNFEMELNDNPIHEIKLSFDEIIQNATTTFIPTFLSENRFRPTWDLAKSVEAKYSKCMPLNVLLNDKNESILNVSISDCYNIIKIHIGANEYSQNATIIIFMFNNFSVLPKKYTFSLRIDKRKNAFAKSVKEARDYLYNINNIEVNVPKKAYGKVYSTWYNFHQDIKQDTLIKELKKAKEFGLETIIIDDGWQIDKLNTGYSYCGDWKIANNRFYDFKKFVQDVHKMGINVMLWLSVPFIGIYSQNYKEFLNMYLEMVSGNIMILDPRYKKVRNFLVNTYLNLLREYDLDGFKLDFIDSFNLNEKSIYNENMDTPSLEEALDLLFKEINTTLRNYKEDILIEFRQNYTCPSLIKSANMIRVADCPLDYITNYREIINLKLTCKIAIHSDMVIFNKNDSIENKALNIYATLFSISQFSFVLNELENDEQKMLKYFTKFYDENKEYLFSDDLMTIGKPNEYQASYVEKVNKLFMVAYENIVISLNDKYQEITIVNMSCNETLYIDSKKQYEYEIIDALGNIYMVNTIQKGINKIIGPKFFILKCTSK